MPQKCFNLQNKPRREHQMSGMELRLLLRPFCVFYGDSRRGRGVGCSSTHDVTRKALWIQPATLLERIHVSVFVRGCVYTIVTIGVYKHEGRSGGIDEEGMPRTKRDLCCAEVRAAPVDGHQTELRWYRVQGPARRHSKARFHFLRSADNFPPCTRVRVTSNCTLTVVCDLLVLVCMPTYSYGNSNYNTHWNRRRARHRLSS